jgi:3-hydroxyisobutyrate dehydrogenase-like beta-hydroxyacid dehydrogenase
MSLRQPLENAMSKVGFIGLGIMGAPMAGHLIMGGHDVFLFSRSGVPAALVEAGGKACACGKEVARNADIIITMVPDTPHVASVLFDADGVAEGLSAGKPVGILATVDADVRRYMDMGVTMLAVGSDQGLFRAATQGLRDKYAAD